MRARAIKPGFFKNEELADLGPYAQILFEGLWCLADREGKLEDRVKRIAAEIFPYYELNPCINDLLDLLHKKKFIIRYETERFKVIKVINFQLHQRPHHNEQASILPDQFQKNQQIRKKKLSTKEKSDSDQSKKRLRSSSLIPSSLIPSSVETSNEVRLSSLLFEKIKSRNPENKPPNLEAWARNIDLMIRVDKRTPEKIERVIEWCQSNPFWQNTILSTEKLREQFDHLVLKMNGQGKKPDREYRIPESPREDLPDLTPEQREMNRQKMHELAESLNGLGIRNQEQCR